MKISIISAFFAFVIFCTLLLLLGGTYAILKTSYYSSDPNCIIVNRQIVQIDKYKVELSENGINEFKEEIINDFFNTENIKYETYKDFRNSIKILKKLVECFDNEVRKHKYPRDDSIIREVNSIFTNILNTIRSKKRIIQDSLTRYERKSITDDISSTRRDILLSNDPILGLIKFWGIIIIFIIIGIFSVKKNN